MENLNKTQAREYNRAKTTNTTLLENKKVYEVYGPFKNKATSFFENMAQLEELVPQKHNNGGYVTVDKNILKTAIADKAEIICLRTRVYAEEIGNNELLSKVAYNHSAFLRLKDADVLGVIRFITDAISPLLSDPAFLAFNVTADMVDALLINAISYDDYIGKAKSVTNDGRFASKTIDVVLKNIRGNIRSLNLLLNNFSNNPKFINAFKEAIKIDRSDIHHSGIEGAIINSAGQPVMGAVVAVKGGKKEVVSDYSGLYKLGVLKPVFTEITITAPGYDTQSFKVKIQRGKFIMQNFTLQSVVINLAAIA